MTWQKGKKRIQLEDKLHCKDKIPNFWNKYSQKSNMGVSVPISTFIRLWEIYIFPRSVCLFCWRKYVDRSWDYINRSQTHECWNWGWGRAIPRKGIHNWDFCYGVASHATAFSALGDLGKKDFVQSPQSDCRLSCKWRAQDANPPPPIPLHIATAGGKRFCQTISNLGHAALLRWCELPL